MAIDIRLASKGQNEPLAALVEQGKVHVGLAKQHAKGLADAGWTAADTTAFEQALGSLETQKAVQADQRGQAKLAGSHEQQGIDKAKGFIRRLRNVLPIVLRKNKSVDADAFNLGSLGRSTSRISAYLTTISKPVATLDPDLKPYFRGANASAELVSVKEGLDQANVSQETALSGLPADTQQVYENKGRVLEAIEDLNRIARNAFDGQAEIIGKFNKDILLRGRRKARTEPVATAQAG